MQGLWEAVSDAPGKTLLCLLLLSVFLQFLVLARHPIFHVKVAGESGYFLPRDFFAAYPFYQCLCFFCELHAPFNECVM